MIALYVYLASVGINILSGSNDPKQIAASVIGFITALMAIAYTTKLMHGTLFKKSTRKIKAQSSSASAQQSPNRVKVRR